VSSKKKKRKKEENDNYGCGVPLWGSIITVQKYK